MEQANNRDSDIIIFTFFENGCAERVWKIASVYKLIYKSSRNLCIERAGPNLMAFTHKKNDKTFIFGITTGNPLSQKPFQKA